MNEGDLGGWIEKEENLSQDGNARIGGDAQVYGDARISSGQNILMIGPLGSWEGYTTFFTSEDAAIYVCCGCFFGTLDEFTAKVRERHGDSLFAREYLLAADLAKQRIEGSEEE